MSKLDELFKEKLTDFSVTPSADSWGKVEARLSKKNNTVIWIRWAAVLLFGGLVLGSIWLQSEETPVSISKGEVPIKEKDENTIQPQVVVAEEKEEKQKNVIQKQTKTKSQPQPVFQPKQVHIEAELAEAESVNAEPAEAEPAEAEPVKAEPVEASIVLTYTLESIEPPVEEKIQPVQVAAADTKTMKDKSLKRMVKFARDVKNGDTPLTGLRDMKEDLFALDLKKKTTTSKN